MFKTTAYTADGKVVPSKKSGRPNAWLRVAGPFAPGASSGNKRWEKVWQNKKLSCFRIEGAELIDVDGVVEYFEADQIKLAPSAAASAECGAPALAQTSRITSYNVCYTKLLRRICSPYCCGTA